MNLPVRTRPGHEIPPWVSDGSFFFITINCEPRMKNQLCRERIGQAVLAAAAHNHEALVWHCRLMLLMPDHLHAVIAFPREAGMKTTITNWKRFLTRSRENRLATRFLRSSFARPPRGSRKDQLHPVESGKAWHMQTGRRLAVDLSPQRPNAAYFGAMRFPSRRRTRPT